MHKYFSAATYLTRRVVTLLFLYRWALIKDEAVYQRMSTYVKLNCLGISRDAQLRAYKLLKVVMEGSGREIFEFGHATMKNRWEKLSSALSVSKRFSIQDIAPQYCTFFQTVRAASPGDFSI